MSFFMASTDPLEASLHLSRDEVTTPSWRTSLQLLRVKVWAIHSALLVRMGVRIQCFLSCLTGVMQFYIKVFCLSRKTNSYPCPLAAYRRLLLGLFFLSSLAFWMASFFSFICVTDEAKRQPTNLSPCLLSGPEFCTQLFPPSLSVSLLILSFM